MDRIDDDAWIKSREDALERAWTGRLPQPEPGELGEDDLPF